MFCVGDEPVSLPCAYPLSGRDLAFIFGGIFMIMSFVIILAALIIVAVVEVMYRSHQIKSIKRRK